MGVEVLRLSAGPKHFHGLRQSKLSGTESLHKVAPPDATCLLHFVKHASQVRGISDVGAGRPSLPRHNAVPLEELFCLRQMPPRAILVSEASFR